MSFTKTILIAILLISLVYVKNQDSCIASIQKSIYSFNSSNPDFSNPALASGTNLNDLGKYDACIENVNMTYLLVNFPLPTGSSEDLKNITLKVFIGLCAPKNSCENNQSYHEIAQFIVDKTNSSSLTVNDVKVISSVAENNKYKHFTFSHYLVLLILIVYLFFALGFVNYIYSFKTNNPDDSKVNLSKTEDNLENSEFNPQSNLRINLSDKSSIVQSAPLIPPIPSKENVIYSSKIHRVAATLFDFPRNFNSIFENRNTEEFDLKIFDGIRAMTAAWVILCHSFITFTEMPQRNPETVLYDYVKTFRWQILFNSSFAVDIFFAMSGFLMTYMTLRKREEMQKSSCLKIVMGILLRLLRIWPLFFICFLAYWKFYIYFLDGPFSGFIFNNEIESCNVQWPFMMTLINNFSLGRFENDKYPWCFSWGWYIPNDFQLSIIGILFMLFYLKNRKFFYYTFTTLCLGCFAGEIYEFYHYKLGVNLFDMNQGGAQYMFVYYMIYVRCGPYFIGYLLGIFYAEYKEDEKHDRQSKTRSFFISLKTNKMFYIFSYLMGIFIMLLMVFVVYFSYETEWTLIGKVIYNVLSRKGFIIGFFMTCLPIMQGNLQTLGGWMGSDFFQPLSKVSFALYVIHPFVIRYIYYNFRHAIYFEMSFLFLYASSFIFVTYILSFFVTAIFETPFMHLRKLLDNRQVKTLSKVDVTTD